MSFKLPSVIAPLPGGHLNQPNDSQPNRKDSVTTMINKLEAKLDKKLESISTKVEVESIADGDNDALPAKIILYRDILERAKRLHNIYSWKEEENGNTTTNNGNYQILSKEFQDLIEAYEYLMGERELFERTFSNYKKSSNLDQSHCLLTIDSCPTTLLDDPMQWDLILKNGFRDYQHLDKELRDLKERNLFLKDSLASTAKDGGGGGGGSSASQESDSINLQSEILRLNLLILKRDEEVKTKEERDLYLRNSIVTFMKLGSDNKSELFSLLKDLLSMNEDEVESCRKATLSNANTNTFSFMKFFS